MLMVTNEAILIFHTTNKLLGNLNKKEEADGLLVCILYILYILLYLIFIMQTNKVNCC